MYLQYRKTIAQKAHEWIMYWHDYDSLLEKHATGSTCTHTYTQHKPISLSHSYAYRAMVCWNQCMLCVSVTIFKTYNIMLMWNESKPAKATSEYIGHWLHGIYRPCVCVSSVKIGSFILYFGRVMQCPFFSIITQGKTHTHTFRSKNNFLRLLPMVWDQTAHTHMHTYMYM